MDLFGHLRHSAPVPPPSEPPAIDRVALRDEMKRTDPDFRRVTDVQHDALNVLGGQSLADGIAIRRERLFWEKHGRGHRQ